MANSPIQKGFEWIYNNFKTNTAKMLIWTGVAGWGLSSLAQIGAVVFNPKIPREQKSFLVPQEFLDAAVNVGSFFLVTQATRKIISKMASTGKIAPMKVRNFLTKHKGLYGDKIGKVDFDLDKILAKHTDFPKDEYYSYKNYITTLGTVGASVLSSNLITPVVRNSLASDVQKKYINNRPNPMPNTNMKI